MKNIKPCVQCGTDFEFNTHNQKYCSPQCCRVATNKRIMDKYYAKKSRLSGETRLCECGSKLSMYSPENICTLCQNKKKRGKTKLAIEVMINAANKPVKAKGK